MMNGKTSHPVPGPLCNTFAPLVPVLDDLTDTRLAADTRAHLAECAWCRAQQTSYERFDEALRRQFAPEAMPYVTIQVIGATMTDVRDDVQPFAFTEDTATDDDQQMRITPLPAQPIPPRRSRRMITGAASLAAVLVISLLAGAVFMMHGRPLPPASRHATGAPSIVPGSQITLMAVGMSSATDGWAMGRQMVVDAKGGSSGSSEDPAYVLHYTGGRWVLVQTPIRAWIQAIKMLSPTDGWAIGTRAYHYDGISWREIHMPVQTQFNAIAAVSAHDIWLAGDGSPIFPPNGRSVILHFDGSGWFQQSTPSVLDNFSIRDISMISASDGWAVGSATPAPDAAGNAPPTGVVLRYHSGAWTVAKTLPDYDLRTISMGSPTDGWIGGNKVTYAPGYPSIGGKPPQNVMITDSKLWHFTGGQWTEARLPNVAGAPPNGQITKINLFSATDGWLFAALDTQSSVPDNATQMTPDIFRLEQGRWVQVPIPVIQARRYANMGQVAFVSPDEFWGVGSSTWWTGIPDSSDGYQPTVTPLIVHYDRGVWKVIAY
jgi:hypothetical protein